jgi:hypothetical protein
VSGGTFFHYILAKLGASLAHLTPSMKGRAMCEVFGAYGWGEDTPMMKYLIDFLLVRGINHFVPHAFSPTFPDGDCPPHFGGEGHDPSYEGFSTLMRYTNRAAHILQGATHIANAAVLYHMEGEWSSRFNEAMTMEPIAVQLYDAHIDYDIVCSDMLNGAVVRECALSIADERFDCLIVPYADHLPNALQSRLKELQEAGVPIWFVNGLPENLIFDGKSVQLDEIVPLMKKLGMTDVEVEEGYPFLRIYHCVREGKDLFMFANEDYGRSVNTTVKLPCNGDYMRLDLLSEINVGGTTDDGYLKLHLLPNQSQIIVFGNRDGVAEEFSVSEIVPLTPSYELALANCNDLSKFTPCGIFDHFFNVNSPSFYPDFSGKMRYTFRFNAVNKGKRVFMDLGRVGQNAALILNGKELGMRISRPYWFDITEAMQDGENYVEVIVSNTLAQRVRDHFSHKLQLSPAGLMGEVTLRYMD